MTSKSGSMKSRVIRSSLWIIGGYGLGQILRFGNNVILARLLAPEMFGLMVLINTFLMGIELFSDIGIGQSLIQNPNGEDPKFYRTAWTIQVIRGAGLWMVCLLATHPLASFYNEEKILYLFPLAGLSVIIGGFNSTSLAIIGKRLMQARLTILELFIQLVSLISMISWALISPGILALIFGRLVGSTIRMIASHFILPDIKQRFELDSKVIGEILGFGIWIFFSSILLFLSQQGDRLLLGKIIPLDLLGVYGIARALSNILRLMLLKLSNNVIFPAASELANIPRKELHRKVSKYRSKFILLSSVVCALFITFSDSIIFFLYDERYQAASWMMPILMIGVWFNCLFLTSMPVLNGIGQPKHGAFGNFAKTGAMVLGILLGSKYLGFPGAILAVSLSELCAYLAIQFGLFKSKLLFFKDDALAFATLLGSIFIFSSARSLFGFGNPLLEIFEVF